MLVSACGGSSSPGVAAVDTTTASATTDTTSTSNSAGGSAQLSAALAFARCMRSHGVPDFPDPDPDSQGNFPSLHLAESTQTTAAANDACKHLRGTATPKQRQQKLAFSVKVAQCLRAHGYPNFPDPTRLGEPPKLPPGIDLDSPQFRAAETNCERRAQKALGLP
jgi:hypothetical protein